jgi:cytochrome c-type biogenesis protein CcmH/NrfF
MYRLRNKRLSGILLLGLVSTSLWAQTAAQIESEEVKRVGMRLACQCGSCKSTVSCEMPGGCGYCKRMKGEIARMQMAGKSDKVIIDQLVKENGPQIYLAEPGTWGWLTPYLAAALGLAVIYWFVRRSLKAPVAAGGAPVDHEVLDKYHERIERDLEKLE